MRVVEESEVVEEEMGRGEMGWKVWGRMSCVRDPPVVTDQTRLMLGSINHRSSRQRLAAAVVVVVDGALTVMLLP